VRRGRPQLGVDAVCGPAQQAKRDAAMERRQAEMNYIFAIVQAAKAFDVDPVLVLLNARLIATGRKDLEDAVWRGRLTVQQALRIARKPRSHQGDLFEQSP